MNEINFSIDDVINFMAVCSYNDYVIRQIAIQNLNYSFLTIKFQKYMWSWVMKRKTIKGIEILKKFLSCVKYNDFELTGKDMPYFLGRWFDKQIDGVNHKVTVTSGSLFYFLISGVESFDLIFTKIKQKGNTSICVFSRWGKTYNTAHRRWNSLFT